MNYLTRIGLYLLFEGYNTYVPIIVCLVAGPSFLNGTSTPVESTPDRRPDELPNSSEGNPPLNMNTSEPLWYKGWKGTLVSSLFTQLWFSLNPHVKMLSRGSRTRLVKQFLIGDTCTTHHCTLQWANSLLEYNINKSWMTKCYMAYN